MLGLNDMPKFIDITGHRYGDWTVLKRAPTRNLNTYWSCKCDCGTIRQVISGDLRFGKSVGCGCADGRFVSSIIRYELSYIPEPNSGCYLWMGYLDQKGYGRIKINGKSFKAHKFAYEHFIGPVAEGLELDHLCRIRCCVNPWHLEPKLHSENVRCGDQAKLSWVEVDKIRQIYSESNKTYKELAVQFNVYHGTIARVIREETWKKDT